MLISIYVRTCLDERGKMQVLSRGFLLYLLHLIWPHLLRHIRLKDALKHKNAAKCNLSKVKHKTMLASGLRY